MTLSRIASPTEARSPDRSRNGSTATVGDAARASDAESNTVSATARRIIDGR